MANKWTPETPWFDDGKKTEAHWPNYVCRNKNCKSFGKSHPNCHCGAPSFSRQSKNLEYAKGGEVHYCSTLGNHNEKCEHFADGGQIEENTKLSHEPGLSIDHVAAEHGLHHLLSKTGHSKSENKNKHSEEYMDHSKKGHKKTKHHMGSMHDKKYEAIEPKKESIGSLKSHLDSIHENPSKTLDVGGSLGQVFPDHAAELAAKTAVVADYFQSIKPLKQQNRPLDDPSPIDKIAESNYNRQLGLAEHPLSILSHVRSGTVLPSDLVTLNTIYPKLAKSMKEKAMDSFVESQSKGENLSYKHKMGLSAFLGVPLDSTMTQAFMSAIIQSQTEQMPTQQVGKNPSKATGVELKQINKVNALYETPLEARQIKDRE